MPVLKMKLKMRFSYFQNEILPIGQVELFRGFAVVLVVSQSLKKAWNDFVPQFSQLRFQFCHSNTKKVEDGYTAILLQQWFTQQNLWRTEQFEGDPSFNGSTYETSRDNFVGFRQIDQNVKIHPERIFLRSD